MKRKKFTKEAITQIEYFKIYFNKVYLVEFYTWENMINIQEKKGLSCKFVEHMKKYMIDCNDRSYINFIIL